MVAIFLLVKPAIESDLIEYVILHCAQQFYKTLDCPLNCSATTYRTSAEQKGLLRNRVICLHRV